MGREGRTIVKIYGTPEKPVGTLYSDGIYETVRDTREHFFRKFQSYGISKWMLSDAKSLGCVYIDIEERGVRVRVLRSPIEKWFSFAAHEYTDPTTGDLQLHLPVREMNVEYLGRFT